MLKSISKFCGLLFSFVLFLNGLLGFAAAAHAVHLFNAGFPFRGLTNEQAFLQSRVLLAQAVEAPSSETLTAEAPAIGVTAEVEAVDEEAAAKEAKKAAKAEAKRLKEEQKAEEKAAKAQKKAEEKAAKAEAKRLREEQEAAEEAAEEEEERLEKAAKAEAKTAKQAAKLQAKQKEVAPEVEAAAEPNS